MLQPLEAPDETCFLPQVKLAKKKVYVAGPMTGIPHFNFPAFHAAAADLRKRGYDVESPAELDSPAAKRAAEGSPDGDPSHYAKNESWGDMLARDVKLIADNGIEMVVVLPGWEASKGARLETFVAHLCNIPLVEYPNLTPVEASDIHDAHGPAKTETRITDHLTGGQKGAKLAETGALDPDALLAVAEVAGFGTKKYARLNYMKGFAWSLSFDALMRHALEFWAGREVDEESGLPHIAHAIWQAMCLYSYSKHGIGTDDRICAGKHLLDARLPDTNQNLTGHGSDGEFQ